MAERSPEARRRVLRSFTYGVHVATARAGDTLGAGTVTWVSQASFDPPLVMVAIKVGSKLHSAIEETRAFALHVVGDGQQDQAAAFLRQTQVADATVNGVPFEPGPATGAPILATFPLWCELAVTDSVHRGDHTVFVARVVNSGVRDDSAKALALRDTGWSYGG